MKKTVKLTDKQKLIRLRKEFAVAEERWLFERTRLCDAYSKLYYAATILQDNAKHEAKARIKKG